MKWNEIFAVSQQKVEALRNRLEQLKIQMPQIEESFTAGGGKGGQKINKTANKVVLYYPPLDIRVSCQRERQRNVNRFLALRELVDQIEMKVSPNTSARLKKWRKIQKQKARRRRRSASQTDRHPDESQDPALDPGSSPG